VCKQPPAGLPIEGGEHPSVYWLSKPLGLNDFFATLKRLFGGIRSMTKGLGIMTYVYLLFLTVNQFVKWLAHWQ